MRHRFLLGAVIGVAAAFSWADAQAQWLSAPSGPATFYLGPEGGWTNLENSTVTAGGLSATQTNADGFNVGVRAGYMWGPWRFEEEFNFAQNGITGVGPLALKGNTNRIALMTNAIYDFNLGWPVTPHLGVGIGAVNLNLGASFAPLAGAQVARGNSWQFGYQALAGVRYNVNPNLAFDVDYRYLGTTDPTFRTTVGAIPIQATYSTHNIVASITVMFGGAPPAPPVMAPAPPAPPPSARKVFLVFFDWDRDTVTPEGMAIIQQAADAFKAGGTVRLMVTGYTDRSGSPGYNQRLSERRAGNVANALARMGVPRNQMAVSGRGENDNRVPTADGVREPQNRRVEIAW